MTVWNTFIDLKKMAVLMAYLVTTVVNEWLKSQSQLGVLLKKPDPQCGTGLEYRCTSGYGSAETE